MAIYNDILQQAGGDHKSAGDLHERLWENFFGKKIPVFTTCA